MCAVVAELADWESGREENLVAAKARSSSSNWRDGAAIRFAESAIADPQTIRHWIADQGPDVGDRRVREIIRRIEALQEYPEMGCWGNARSRIPHHRAPGCWFWRSLVAPLRLPRRTRTGPSPALI